MRGSAWIKALAEEGWLSESLRLRWQVGHRNWNPVDVEKARVLFWKMGWLFVTTGLAVALFRFVPATVMLFVGVVCLLVSWYDSRFCTNDFFNALKKLCEWWEVSFPELAKMGPEELNRRARETMIETATQIWNCANRDCIYTTTTVETEHNSRTRFAEQFQILHTGFGLLEYDKSWYLEAARKLLAEKKAP